MMPFRKFIHLVKAFAVVCYSGTLCVCYCFHCSGTEKQHVAYDYAKRLHIGQVECEVLVQDVAGAFIVGKSGSSPPDFQSCEYLNVSICPATEQGNVRL